MCALFAQGLCSIKATPLLTTHTIREGGRGRATHLEGEGAEAAAGGSTTIASGLCPVSGSVWNCGSISVGTGVGAGAPMGSKWSSKNRSQLTQNVCKGGVPGVSVYASESRRNQSFTRARSDTDELG
jgi:hypothetical protein